MDIYTKKIQNINFRLKILILPMFFISLIIIHFIKEKQIKNVHPFISSYMNKLNIGEVRNLALNITYLDYSYSLKYKIAEFKYCINFNDEYNNLIVPTKLLIYNIHVICHMRYKMNHYNTYNFESIANIYENKYFCCIENFNIGEKLEFGIKVYNTERACNKRHEDLEFFFFKDNILNFKSLNHINDTKFEPLLINEQYNILKNNILSLNNNFKEQAKQNISLKKAFIIRPICSPKTSLKVLNNNWKFKNIYNYYFCFCKGESCFSKKVIKKGQICKYRIYLSIIDQNRYLYNKTDYLLADFYLENLSSDDAYPIFKDMLKRNISAHYMTQKKNIYKKFCGNNEHCQIIINEMFINGDFLEKFLELILKLKAAIFGNGFYSFDYTIFHNIEYITSINLGHGVKYFKSYLYRENATPRQYNKLVLIPSKKVINVALRYGWKEENIIKVCLPKWDKYDKIKSKEIEKSIFIFFTWRQLKKDKNISFEYINNIIKLINSDILNKKIIEKNISLYYCLHHQFSQYKNMIKINQIKLNYITNDQISETLMKSSLLITDFSSVIFDFIYKRKPIIIYIPDSEDPSIKDNYNINYIKIINNIKNGKMHFENKYNTTEQVINKTIFYIDNNFELESNMKKFYNSFGLKCGNNTQFFIDYIQNMK
jgi:hypothetical protein